jgi:hypothetical protein
MLRLLDGERQPPHGVQGVVAANVDLVDWTLVVAVTDAASV